MMDQRLSSGPRMPDSLNGEGALRKALDGPIDGRARKTSNTGDDGNTSSSQSLAIEGCNQVLLSLIEVRKQQGVLPLKFFGFAHSRIIPSPPSFVTLNFLRALTGNSANGAGGGGIYNTDLSITLAITGSTFIGNFTTTGYGGGIANYGTATVSSSTFASNSGYFGGGGIYNSNTLTVNSSTFTGNFADGAGGGGIYNTGTEVRVTNSTFTTNSGCFGGGIYNAGALTLTNSTISGNSANSPNAEGGGICNDSGGALTLNNTIVAGNTISTAGNGSDISGQVQPTSAYNLIGDGSGLSLPGPGNLVGTTADPLDSEARATNQQWWADPDHGPAPQQPRHRRWQL